MADKTGKINQKCYLYNSKFEKSKNTLAKGTKVTITKTKTKNKTEYLYVSKTSKGNSKMWIKKSVFSADKGSKKKKTKKDKGDVKDVKSAIKAASKKKYKYDVSKLFAKSLNGIMGAPYQFMHSCDLPVTNEVQMGRKYIERIGVRMPLLLVTPGLPDFLPSYSKNQRKAIVKALTKKNTYDSGKAADYIKSLLNGKSGAVGRYYTFDFKWKEYYRYVNKLLRYCAICLGIQDVYHYNGYYRETGHKKLSLTAYDKTYNKTVKKGYSQKLGSYKWQKAINKKMRGFITNTKCLAFYLDSETSISESFTTSTSLSQLATGINTLTDTAKEFQFLAGPIAGIRSKAMDPESFSQEKGKLEATAEKFLGKQSNKLFGHLEEAFQTIGKGGHLAFPEIWDDTEFSRSYDVSIKLRTPDGDKISWYLNICVPLIHLLCLAAPRALGPNGYKSPFLIRAFYKGIFNCDMGIITAMNISKGKEGAWTSDGLPTEVDIQISLKDLYSMLTIVGDSTDGSGKMASNKELLRNTCLLDYLGNMCGININEPELSRMVTTYILFTKNQFTDYFSDKWMGILDAISNFELGLIDSGGLKF